MIQLAELWLDDGSVVVVEAATGAGGEQGGIDRVGRSQDLAHKASNTLQASLQKVRPALEAIVDQVRGLAESPDRITVQFGIKVNAQAGVVVAQGTAEANFAVTAEWRNS